MATITRTGYGYVEPNFLSAPRTGQVRGDLPLAEAAATAISATADKALMNGQFVIRGEEDLTLASTLKNAWMVFNEEKLYDERHQMHKDFAMKADQFVDGKIYPRIIKLLPGDTFTTNCVTNGAEIAKGDYLVPNAGTLAKGTAEGPIALKVIAETTMPDGEPGLKVEVVEY